MTKKDFAVQMDASLKSVRKEYGFTQEKMAAVLGISKKTLVEIEKGRSSLGWTGAAAFAAIF
ncbi:MAG: helix-turn-helix domain-containing protein, partial [Anaerotignum sp.]|nr:helix-turn-helix domain-containing protein [Anaerotignum sp.]